MTLLGGHGGKLTTTRALIDSGADVTTFSEEWAKELGIDVDRDCTPEEVGVADGRPSIRHVFDKGLQIEVVGEKMVLPLARFCKELPIAYLGRRDFFERYLVLLDQRNLQFYLERRVDPDERRDDPDLDTAVAVA